MDTTCALDSHVGYHCSDLDISSATDTTEDTQAAPACAVCNGKHTATECCTLRELGLSDRLGKVRALHLCFVCLRPGHVSRACEADIRCEVSECQRRHATVLHGASWPSRARPDTPSAGQLHTRIVQAGAEQDSSAPPPSSPVVQSRGPDTRGPEAVFSGPTIGSNTVQKVKVALPIVAVRIEVSGSSDHVDTYALLDNGSARSFCTKELLDALELEGRRESVVVSTLAGYSYEHAARTADLKVSGVYGSSGLLLRNVHAKDSLPGLMGHIGTEADATRWPHLNGLSLPTARADQVALVIGLDNSAALAPLSTIFGSSSDPYAVRTCLGWSLHGVLGKAQHDETPNADLVAADSGSSELAVRLSQVVEQGKHRPASRNSAHQRRSSSSAGLERSSGRRSRRRRRKESGVPSSSIVPDSLPVATGQASTGSKTEPAKRRWFCRAARRRAVDSLHREHDTDSKPSRNLQIAQTDIRTAQGSKRECSSNRNICVGSCQPRVVRQCELLVRVDADGRRTVDKCTCTHRH